MAETLTAKSHAQMRRKPRILIAAYDVARKSSEGHVALSLVEQLSLHTRIVLLTRRNNAEILRKDEIFRRHCPSVTVVGFDLPNWAAWWKKGARFYQAYAYLWQLWWPFVLRVRRRGVEKYDIVHVLNFHNDSFPSSAYILGKPTVWGPINHNELAGRWRREKWPTAVKISHVLKYALRRIQWRIDPLLLISVNTMGRIISAGPWVDGRLRVRRMPNVIHRSQLGLHPNHLCCAKESEAAEMGVRLICAGRLDWIKGIDLAIEALTLLPISTRLTLIGDGPSRFMLEALALDKGVSDRVQFKSSVSRESLFVEFCNHDLMLFPSAEAAGLVWVEALGCGLPVIAFDGSTEVAQMSDRLPGIVIAQTSSNRSQNVAAYAAAISRASDCRFDRALISKSAIVHYSWQQMTEIFLNIYQSFLAKGR